LPVHAEGRGVERLFTVESLVNASNSSTSGFIARSERE